MVESPFFKITEQDLENLNVTRCRDLILECFFEAQKEAFTRATHVLQIAPGDEGTIYNSIVGVTRLAFKEAGGSFDRPTRQGMHRVVDILARKAITWGTSRFKVEGHREEMHRLIDRCREESHSD